jgi:hypothetical protein
MTIAQGTPEAQKEALYNKILSLPDEALPDVFEFLDAWTPHIPNAETIEAMRDVERIARDPSVKKYATAEELIAELRAECIE